ncbi:MAG: Flp pilus assembly complex ATPase component TadA [Candidatus Thermoplasmatota archaeon]|nr:Flp pilus assembly complex ATPase component TadA [Candidatus Thermoplasmatota archaeon]MBU4256560.1 Flp pilus assembly complex ATPase component TadA [Candidatus Thermoplasmatota archaeon]
MDESEKESEIVERYKNITIKKIEGKYVPEYEVEFIQEKKLPYLDLEPLIADDNLEEIVYNGPAKYVKVYHRKYGVCTTNVTVSNEDIKKVLNEIASFVGKKIDAAAPLFDGRLPDGSRVNATVQPASPDGPTLTIRKFLKDPMTIVDLIKNGTVNSLVGAHLWLWVEGLKYKPSNVILSGGSSSGKTTTMNVLAMLIPVEERLITIEDAAELQLEHEHWIRMEAVPASRDVNEVSMDALLKNTLRMRPDRIIIGEIRSKEANTLFNAMNTGHEGCMGTVHANTASETIIRLTTPPMSVEPMMLMALDIIIMHQRMTIKGGGSVRRIVEISEIAGLEKNRPRLNTIFKWDPASNTLKETGVPSKLREKISRAANISLKEFDEILRERQEILDGLVIKNYRDAKTVTEVIQNYYLKKAEEPEKEEETGEEEEKKRTIFGKKKAVKK